MEKYILIACAMQQDEIEHIQEENHIEYPVIYLPRGMHENPTELHALLMERISEYQDYDTILLSYGLCGGAADGLVSEHTRLVMPRFHDCIHQLMCNKVDKESLYMTRAWTVDKQSILGQCSKVQGEYDKEDAEAILEAIYGNYKCITVIDTGSYTIEETMDNAREAAAILNMKTRIMKSDCGILEKLLKVEWDDNFIITHPGEAVRTCNFL